MPLWNLVIGHAAILAGVAIGLLTIVTCWNAIQLFFLTLKGQRTSQSATARTSYRDPLVPKAGLEMLGRTRMTGDFRLFTQEPQLHVQALILAAIMTVPSVSLAGDNWTSFQNGGAPIRSPKPSLGNYELEWTARLAGYGQSSPVAWNGHLYVTFVSGKNKETLHMTAFNVESGKQVWAYEFPNASPQESSNYVSKAAPTPVVDEHGVICFFEGGNLLALTHDGELRWQRNLIEDFGAIDSRHGLGSSLEQNADSAFVWVERETEPYLLSIDKQNGRDNWKVSGLGVTSWASPRLIPIAGGQHLVLSGIGLIVGFDPATGERLWTFDEISGNSTPTPIPIEKGKFLIGATVGRGDSDSGRAAESNGLIAIKKSETGNWQAKFLWQSKRATSSFGSPIVADGYCYFVNRTGVMYCLDAATGEEQYAERIGGSIWATPLTIPGQLILPLKDGKLVIAASGKKFKSMRELEVFAPQPEPIGTEPPAFDGETLYAGIMVGPRLILRSGETIYSFNMN